MVIFFLPLEGGGPNRSSFRMDETIRCLVPGETARIFADSKLMRRRSSEDGSLPTFDLLLRAEDRGVWENAGAFDREDGAGLAAGKLDRRFPPGCFA